MIFRLFSLRPFLGRLFKPFGSRSSLRERRRNGSGNGNAIKDFSKMTLQETMTELQRAAEQSRDVFVETLRNLAGASEDGGLYTRGHSERVTRFSVEIAKLMGLPEKEIEAIRIGALIHDIGKIAIDDAIVNKPAILTDAEYAVMKTHTTRGYELMSRIPHLKDITPAIRDHHELLDGKGYPCGLKGDEISMIARIITVADCFDAMTTARPYQDPAPIEYVLDKMRSAAGVKYDEQVVEALIRGVKTGRIIARSEDRTR